ncbi:MAG: Txe/YoeB family addiction module toxin [Bacteroidota bacterium]|nr:Txe/YoeB family addiction module toxin [Bacteroidota bacterium]MDP4274619.1 Txe/YoeB family addiction module toxin [Bacteroidota bacterium]
MEIEYTLQASEDLVFWKKSNNVTVLKKIRKLIESISETPCEGIGKPEPLKYDLLGCWSRRINKEHRIVYELHEDKIIVLSIKGHY